MINFFAPLFKGKYIEKTAQLLVVACLDLKTKWSKEPLSQLKEFIPQEFDERSYYSSGDSVYFICSEIPDFKFFLSAIHGDRTSRQLDVVGLQRYNGFMMFTDGDVCDWNISIENYIGSNATSDSRKLAKYLREKHHINSWCGAY